MAAKLINVHLPFTIASSQLVWSKHARERMLERGVVLPRGIQTWEMVDYRWNEGFSFPAILLRHRGSGAVISVTKEMCGLYKVITTYWDEEEVING